MSDRFPADLTIGGAVPRSLVAALCETISAPGPASTGKVAVTPDARRICFISPKQRDSAAPSGSTTVKPRTGNSRSSRRS